MTISIHDNKLLSYTVSEIKSEIRFETIFENGNFCEYTSIIFSNVAVYYFENHALSLGTIIYSVEQTDATRILEDNWKKFEQGKKYGWPGDWASTKENALAYFKENSIKGYCINSSCGLHGWVLAENIQLQSKRDRR